MTSIGLLLKKARERRRLTQDDVSKYIKISVRYVKALEGDDYSVFADRVHSKGFLKLYVSFLNLNEDEVLAIWRREYEHFFDDSKKDKKPVVTYAAPKFLITPSVVGVVLVSAALFVFFGYLYYQYRHYTGSPRLSIYHPKENLVVDKAILDITGSTDLDSEVYLNSQKVVLNPDGSFAESIRLREGMNTISIKAVNKLDKETEYIRTIIYRPQEEVRVEETIESTQSTPSIPSLNSN